MKIEYCLECNYMKFDKSNIGYCTKKNISPIMPLSSGCNEGDLNSAYKGKYEYLGLL